LKEKSLRKDKELNGYVINPSTFATGALAQFDFPVVTTLFGFGHLVTY